MPSTIQVGAILTNRSPLMAQLFGLQSEPCSGNWSLLKVLDGFTLDRQIHAAGWNFFFMAAEVKVMFFGALGAEKIQNAVQRILAKVKGRDFNCLEITGITSKSLLGLRYAIITAHSRHLQQGCCLDSAS